MKRHNVIVLVLMVFGLFMLLGPSMEAAPVPAPKKNKKMSKKDLKKDAFYEVTRFIMTKEEKDIYKHLPDIAARNDFIEEFWEKRDPDPSTDENESKIEYATRIAYANKWFKEHSKGRGWDTERGRILLRLGMPDRREFGEYTPTYRGRLISSKRIPMEIWTYYRYGPLLVLEFADTDDSGHLKITRVPSALPTVMDFAKFNLDLRSEAGKKRKSFKFYTKFHKGNLNISVPIKKVAFEEMDDGSMKVDFNIVVYVYHNSAKVDEIKSPKSVAMEKDKVLKLKHLEFAIPYPLSEKGKYYFDVVIEDIGSETKYRNFTTYKM